MTDSALPREAPAVAASARRLPTSSYCAPTLLRIPPPGQNWALVGSLSGKGPFPCQLQAGIPARLSWLTGSRCWVLGDGTTTAHPHAALV